MGKGQEDLTALLLKDKKKKSKKTARILNLRRRPKTQDLATPSDTVVSLEENHNVEIDEEEADYSEEQYPLTDDKYKELEDRLNAMEIQQIPGLDLGDMGLVPGLVIPPKFKVPTVALYDGVSCPKMHFEPWNWSNWLMGRSKNQLAALEWSELISKCKNDPTLFATFLEFGLVFSRLLNPLS